MEVMCKLGSLNEPVGFLVSSLNNLRTSKIIRNTVRKNKQTNRIKFFNLARLIPIFLFPSPDYS